MVKEKYRDRGCIYIYMYTHTYIYIYIYLHLHIYIEVIHTYMYTCTHIHTCLHACIHGYVRRAIYIYRYKSLGSNKDMRIEIEICRYGSRFIGKNLDINTGIQKYIYVPNRDHMIPVLGSPTPPPQWYPPPPPPTLPKPNLCDCAHVFHMRAPKATTVTRIASQEARSV